MAAKRESQTAPKTRKCDEDIGEKEIACINHDNLMEDISNRLKLIEEKEPQYPKELDWPPDLQELKEILSPGECSQRKLKEIISKKKSLEEEIISKKKSSKLSRKLGKLKNKAQKTFVFALKVITSGPVRQVLEVLGLPILASAALFVVSKSLAMYEQVCSNKKKCLELLKEMYYMASLVKDFKESPKGFHNVIQDATSLIVEGAITCSTQIDSSFWVQFSSESDYKTELSEITEKLHRMYMKMNVKISLRVLTATEPEKSPLWKQHPKHAVGIQESITEVLKLLECESDQKAVTVILHGVEGIGKTTLAEAVFSRIEGCKYSKVRLFKDIDSTRDIIEFQKKILKDLMGPEDFLPDIRTHEDGQDALEDMLEKVEAFIYIDNVLKSSELQRLLPKNLANAKKVRFLLTARNIEDLKYACPTPPKIHPMKGIHSHKDGLSILEKEIREGINDKQFKEIIQICGGSPMRLTLVAPLIGRANDKKRVYERLMQDKGKWENEGFDEMRCRFAHYEEDKFLQDVNTPTSRCPGEDPTTMNATSETRSVEAPYTRSRKRQNTSRYKENQDDLNSKRRKITFEDT